MTTLRVYVDDRTYAWLQLAAADLGRSVEELAESAVAEAALDYGKKRPRGIEQVQDDLEKLTNEVLPAKPALSELAGGPSHEELRRTIDARDLDELGKLQSSRPSGEDGKL